MREHVHEYFDMRPGQDSPYMLLVASVREEQRTPYDASDESVFGIDRLNRLRSTVPAITHVDYSARVQTVDRERHPLLHRLMECFHSRTGVPVLINTSFNVRGEPIVCTPADALRCFQKSGSDCIISRSAAEIVTRCSLATGAVSSM